MNRCSFVCFQIYEFGVLDCSDSFAQVAMDAMATTLRFLRIVWVINCDVLNCELSLCSINVWKMSMSEGTIAYSQISMFKFDVVLIVVVEICIRYYSLSYVCHTNCRACLWAQRLIVSEEYFICNEKRALCCCTNDCSIMSTHVFNLWSIL